MSVFALKCIVTRLVKCDSPTLQCIQRVLSGTSLRKLPDQSHQAKTLIGNTMRSWINTQVIHGCICWSLGYNFCFTERGLPGSHPQKVPKCAGGQSNQKIHVQLHLFIKGLLHSYLNWQNLIFTTKCALSKSNWTLARPSQCVGPFSTVQFRYHLGWGKKYFK